MNFKLLFSFLEKIVAPLIIAGIIAIFGMHSRLEKVEAAQRTLEQRLDEFSIDLKVIRCLSGDAITCKVIGISDDGKHR